MRAQVCCCGCTWLACGAAVEEHAAQRRPAELPHLCSHDAHFIGHIHVGTRFLRAMQAARLDAMLEALDATGRLPPGRLEELVGGLADKEQGADGRGAGEGNRWLRSPSPRRAPAPATPPKSPGCGFFRAAGELRHAAARLGYLCTFSAECAMSFLCFASRGHHPAHPGTVSACTHASRAAWSTNSCGSSSRLPGGCASGLCVKRFSATCRHANGWQLLRDSPAAGRRQPRGAAAPLQSRAAATAPRDAWRGPQGDALRAAILSRVGRLRQFCIFYGGSNVAEHDD
jgi:hypothetical protein